MEIKLDRLDDTTALVDMTFEWSDIKNLVSQKIKKLVSQIHLKGFRRGNIPQKIIQNQYQNKIIEEIVYKYILGKLDQFLQKKNLYLFKIDSDVNKLVYNKLQNFKKQRIKYEELKINLSLRVRINSDINLNLNNFTIDKFIIKSIEQNYLDIFKNSLRRSYGKAISNSDDSNFFYGRVILKNSEIFKKDVVIPIVFDIENIKPNYKKKIHNLKKGDKIKLKEILNNYLGTKDLIFINHIPQDIFVQLENQKIDPEFILDEKAKIILNDDLKEFYIKMFGEKYDKINPNNFDQLIKKTVLELNQERANNLFMKYLFETLLSLVQIKLPIDIFNIKETNRYELDVKQNLIVNKILNDQNVNIDINSLVKFYHSLMYPGEDFKKTNLNKLVIEFGNYMNKKSEKEKSLFYQRAKMTIFVNTLYKMGKINIKEVSLAKFNDYLFRTNFLI